MFAFGNFCETARNSFSQIFLFAFLRQFLNVLNCLKFIFLKKWYPKTLFQLTIVQSVNRVIQFWGIQVKYIYSPVVMMPIPWFHWRRWHRHIQRDTGRSRRSGCDHKQAHTPQCCSHSPSYRRIWKTTPYGKNTRKIMSFNACNNDLRPFDWCICIGFLFYLKLNNFV